MKSITINVQLDGSVLGSRDTIAVHIDPLTLAQLYRDGKQAEEDRLEDMVDIEVVSASTDNTLGMVQLGKPVQFMGTEVGFCIALSGHRAFIATISGPPDKFINNPNVSMDGKQRFKIKRELYLKYYAWKEQRESRLHVQLPCDAKIKAGTPVYKDGNVIVSVTSSAECVGGIAANIRITDPSVLGKIYNDKPVTGVSVKQFKYELGCGDLKLGELTSAWCTPFMLMEILADKAPGIFFKEL